MNKLDEAKINLKEVMERLNKAIDKSLIVSKNSTVAAATTKMQGLQEELAKLHTEIDDKKDEINYLREQNSELQAKIGEAQHESFVLESKNRETSEKIDKVISQVKHYLGERNLI